MASKSYSDLYLCMMIYVHAKCVCVCVCVCIHGHGCTQSDVCMCEVYDEWVRDWVYTIKNRGANKFQ